MAVLGLLPFAANADECHRLYLDAHVCLQAGQELRWDVLTSKDGTTQLVEIVLEQPFPETVYVSFLAARGNADLTLKSWTENLTDRVQSRAGQRITRSDTFRHRGALGQILHIHDESDPSTPIWGAYIGLEVSDGVVMTAISRKEDSSPSEIAKWADAALNALYPEGGS